MTTSPFPGMDPYLERHWPSVHAQLVSGASRLLNRLLPDDLVARPEERTTIGFDDDANLLRRVVPDARVFEVDDEPSTSPAAGPATVTAPFKLMLESEPAVERFVTILNAADERLVTVVEFVSPTNKTLDGADTYLAKRGELLAAGVHVVEVDLVRRGNWRRLLEPHFCPRAAVAEYRAGVRVGSEPSAVYLFPAALRHPLPSVPVPLRRADPPVLLDVQQLVADAYAEDRYGRTIDYAAAPDPPLSPADAAWADALLRAAGRRA